MSRNWEPIEGETSIDPSGLKIKGIKTRNELLPYEAENIRKVVVKYLASRPTLRSAPFDLDWMLQVHREMFGDVWKWAGVLRQIDVNFGSPWYQVDHELRGFVLDIQAWETKADFLLEQSVQIHHRTVQIHPFENGNGRWSRMLANIWLKRHGKRPIEWPEAGPDNLASEIRTEYLAAVKSADEFKEGPLTELHRRFWPE